MSGVSERLREIRASLGESQKGMAKRVGLGENGWQTLERENRAPKGEILAMLVELGFSADWLISGEGRMRRGAPPEAIDSGRLRVAVEMIEDWLEDNNREMTAQKKAEVVAMAYEILTESQGVGSEVGGRNNVIRLLRAAS